MTSLKEIVEIIRRDKGLKQYEVEVAVRHFLKVTRELLEAGETVQLPDFGIFTVKTKKARTVNFLGQQEIEVPPHGILRFKACQSFRDAVWGVMDDE